MVLTGERMAEGDGFGPNMVRRILDVIDARSRWKVRPDVDPVSECGYRANRQAGEWNGRVARQRESLTPGRDFGGQRRLGWNTAWDVRCPVTQ
jgi:hypothetical protein